ncbi:uncharacterized protein EV420DRAFT_1477351 [Desarmillaria tabescens]|uniref:Uncharacterized protein n=1 Tax=Armillaria tabescens TaxID=1929756 RepID=A0AA39TXV9_ARMTA|nr:uncharacterized protein EV420DRAFT_1477351 [Desarmillaria tabescens]KAK0462660.1 hypothetical protein EV420DRAFT_1477351 [Desarmillaria tabescens]
MSTTEARGIIRTVQSVAEVSKTRNCVMWCLYEHELSEYFKNSSRHPRCTLCEGTPGFEGDAEFALHCVTAHVEAYCTQCERIVDNLEKHYKGSLLHPKCVWCKSEERIGFPEEEAYVDHLRTVHFGTDGLLAKSQVWSIGLFGDASDAMSIQYHLIAKTKTPSSGIRHPTILEQEDANNAMVQNFVNDDPPAPTGRSLTSEMYAKSHDWWLHFDPFERDNSIHGKMSSMQPAVAALYVVRTALKLRRCWIANRALDQIERKVTSYIEDNGKDRSNPYYKSAQRRILDGDFSGTWYCTGTLSMTRSSCQEARTVDASLRNLSREDWIEFSREEFLTMHQLQIMSAVYERQGKENSHPILFPCVSGFGDGLIFEALFTVGSYAPGICLMAIFRI